MRTRPPGLVWPLIGEDDDKGLLRIDPVLNFVLVLDQNPVLQALDGVVGRERPRPREVQNADLLAVPLAGVGLPVVGLPKIGRAVA